MNKRFFKYLVLAFAIFIMAFGAQNIIQSLFLNSALSIQSAYHQTIDAIENSFYKHFHQQKHIQELQDKIENCKKDKIETSYLVSQLDDLYKANHSQLKSFANITLVKTLSYANYADFNKVWLDFKDFNQSKIYGLIYDDYAAGIVINKNSKPLALLNADPKSTMAVYILDNKQKAPGIIHGNSNDKLIIEYIPTWIPIHRGDEVITSGLDALFFEGLKVGKVLKVELSQGYQKAVVEPYFKANQPHFFHVITRIK